MNKNSELIKALAQGPSYLILGQRWLINSSGNDPFLIQCQKKFCGTDAAQSQNYTSLFDKFNEQEEAAFQWMAARSLNLPPPERAGIIASYNWNGIFTSAIDDTLSSLLRRPSRDVQRVMDLDYQASDPRSRAKLHVWYLFGNVAAPDKMGWPPSTRLDLTRRKAVATQMSSQLSELVTPLGKLCIEGYEPTTDWLNEEIFYTICSEFQPGQIHWFSAPETCLQNAFIKPLIVSGILTIHKESLASLLLHAKDYSDFHNNEFTDETAWTRRIRINGNVVAVPPELFKQVQTTARLVTEETFAPLKKQTPEEEYSEFRTFLYESSHRPSWSAYARGYAFKREFQIALEKTVISQLSKPSERGKGEPIILHGPTGSGKTVALGQLAFNIQRKGEYVVTFIDRDTRVRQDALDRFCKWAEDSGANAVLIIWDGMTSPRDYFELHLALNSRGRKFVLVGSTYQTEVNLNNVQNSVPVVPKMSHNEQSQFKTFFSSMKFGNTVSFPGHAEEETFLGLLYRLLPSTRSPLQTGLQREVAHASDLIRRQKIISNSIDTKGSQFGTDLETLFKELNIGSAEIPFGEKTKIVEGEEIDEIQQLVGLVMVPGQFGIACPFELLMRTVGREGYGKLLKIIESIDVFALHDDNLGNPIVEARTALEAQIIARQTLAGPKGEVVYATNLLRNIRSSFITGSREIDFAVDLLRSMGPNGMRESYYRPYFADLASCLSELRTQKGVRHPRLLLQESAFLREAAKESSSDQNRGNITKQKRNYLEQAIEVSNYALQILPETRSNRAIRSRLLVELASTWGILANAEKESAERAKMVSQAHDAAWQAYSIDAGNYYALDVIAWTARDILNAGECSTEDRARIVEAVTNAFVIADAEEWNSDAENQFDKRRYELEGTVFSSDISGNALSNLLERGSAAGVVIKAWRIFKSKEFPEIKVRAKMAFDWMDRAEHLKVIEQDSHALYLRFKLWWIGKLGYEFNDFERISPAFTSEDWNDCLKYTNAILASDIFRENPTLRLIEAVSLFQLGDFGPGFQRFESMNIELLVVRHRVIRRFLFSDSEGKPKPFTGTVVRCEGRNGSIQVSGFPRSITFYLNEANRPELKRGDDIQGFNIAFNMVGPIADFRST